MNTQVFMSEYKRQQVETDQRIYEDFCNMVAQPESTRNAICKFLQRKYGIHSISAIYAAIHRHENRIVAGDSVINTAKFSRK